MPYQQHSAVWCDAAIDATRAASCHLPLHTNTSNQDFSCPCYNSVLPPRPATVSTLQGQRHATSHYPGTPTQILPRLPRSWYCTFDHDLSRATANLVLLLRPTSLPLLTSPPTPYHSRRFTRPPVISCSFPGWHSGAALFISFIQPIPITCCVSYG